LIDKEKERERENFFVYDIHICNTNIIEWKDKRARKREIKKISEEERKHLKYENDDERKREKI